LFDHDRGTPDADKLTPVDPTSPLRSAYALQFEGRKRVHNADELMSEIIAKRLVEHLERCGFIVMRRPPIGGSASPYPATTG